MFTTRIRAASPEEAFQILIRQLLHQHITEYQVLGATGENPLDAPPHLMYLKEIYPSVFLSKVAYHQEPPSQDPPGIYDTPELLGSIHIQGEDYTMQHISTPFCTTSWHVIDRNNKHATRFLINAAGAPVGFITIHRRLVDGIPIHIITNIEIREEYRGKGLALRWLRSLESQGVYRQYTTGTCTEAGFKAVAQHLPVLDRRNLKHFLSPLSFIQDWDRMLEK